MTQRKNKNALGARNVVVDSNKGGYKRITKHHNDLLCGASSISHGSNLNTLQSSEKRRFADAPCIMPVISELLGISVRDIYRMIALYPGFPKPITVWKRFYVYNPDAVLGWFKLVLDLLRSRHLQRETAKRLARYLRNKSTL